MSRRVERRELLAFFAGVDVIVVVVDVVDTTEWALSFVPEAVDGL